MDINFLFFGWGEGFDADLINSKSWKQKKNGHLLIHRSRRIYSMPRLVIQITNFSVIHLCPSCDSCRVSPFVLFCPLHDPPISPFFFFPFNYSGGVYTINYTKAFLCLLVETDRSIFFHYFFLFKTLFNFCCLLSYLQACQTSLTTRTSAVTSPRNPVNEWFLLLFEYRLMCGKKTEIFHLSIFLLYLSSHIFFPD